MKVCDWCLGQEGVDNNWVRDYPIGHPTGSQRDPVQRFLMLCGYCINSLEANLDTFHSRFRDEREIRREESDG